MAAFYGGIAFVIIQIIDGAFSYLHIPEWFGTAIIVLLLIGFPISMILAWVFDITPEGIVRTEGRPTGKPGTSNRTLIAVTIFAVAFGIWASWGGRGGDSEDLIRIRSIAVLPLDNNMGGPDQDYFVDGMTDALISQLYKFPGLKVISRTSAMRYKNSDKTVPEMAAELGVDAIVEGAVFKVGDMLRITAQLIDGRTDTHLWSAEYDRSLENIFDLHRDVARAIAREINLTLSPEVESRLARARPVNPEAYDFYLRGKGYMAEGGNYLGPDTRIAIQMYSKAVELDSTFALAYLSLSQARIALYWFHHDRSEENRAKAREAVDRALQLDPELPEAHLALGQYYYHGLLEYDQALAEFGIARKGLANNSDLISFIGFVERRQGKFRSALVNLKVASGLDPRASNLVYNIGETHLFLREYLEAESYLSRANSLRPNWSRPYWQLALLYINWEANLSKSREVLVRGAENVGSIDETFIIHPFVLLEMIEGNYQAALELLDMGSTNFFETQYYIIPKAQLYGQIYGLMAQPQLAYASYDSARSFLETRSQVWPEDARYHSALGIAYAGLGRKEDAIRAGKRGVELLPVSKEAIRGFYRVQDMARIFVMVGEYDQAANQLEYLMGIPGELSVMRLRIDPTWAPLSGQPRFTALLNKYSGR